MDSSEKQWLKAKADNGWEMPRAARWKRLPFVRHVRALCLSVSVAAHNAFWSQSGLIPTGYDEWVLYGISRGWEEPTK